MTNISSVRCEGIGSYKNEGCGDDHAWIFQLPNPMVEEDNMNFTFNIYKGLHHNAVLSRVDTHFIINHPISKLYYNWLQNMTQSVEEHYMPTLLRLGLSHSNVSCFLLQGSTDVNFGLYNLIWYIRLLYGIMYIYLHFTHRLWFKIQ